MTLEDMMILARTLYGEARGESSEGKEWVAHVILNRLKLGRGGSIAAVCLRPKQFSCWNTNDPNLSVIKRADLNDPAFAECVAIASRAQFERDPTNGATHYCVTGANPTWTIGADKIATIGAHTFFRNVP